MAIPATASKRTYREGAEFSSPNVVVVAGSFELAGTSEVTNVRGEGFSVTRTGVGLINITFGTAYPMLIAVDTKLQADTADTIEDGQVQPALYTAATGVLQVITTTEGTPGTEADLTGPRVNFIAVFHKRNALAATYTA